jgi:hypothetical protein
MRTFRKERKEEGKKDGEIDIDRYFLQEKQNIIKNK